MGAETLVMVADPAYAAIRIYHSLGFEVTESNVEVHRPQPPRAPE